MRAHVQQAQRKGAGGEEGVRGRGGGWGQQTEGKSEREREKEREAECSVKSDCKGAKQIETPERFIIILCLVLRQ